MIVQRWLRGRMLYVLLGALVLLLYTRGVQHPKELEPPDTAHSELRAEQTLEWWPGELDAEALKRLSAERPMVPIASAVLGVGMTGLLTGGVVWFLWGVCTGRIASIWRTPSSRLPSWSFSELVRIVLLTILVASLLPFARLAFWAHDFSRRLDPHLWIAGSMLFLDLFVILAVLSFAVEKGQSLRAIFLGRRQRVLGSIRAALQGYVAVFPWLALSLVGVVELVRALGFKPPVELIQKLVFENRSPVVLALTVVLACVVGPIAEELLFRGVLYAALRRRVSRMWAMLASAALFSLIHANVLGFLPIMVLGCVLAYLYDRSGSLISPLTMHIVHNSLLMGVALIFRSLVVR